MKKKVLSALLAVALFVGLAVPAFASSSSAQEATSDEVTALATKKSEYTIRQNEEKALAGEVIAYAGTKKICMSPDLTFELASDTADFALTDDGKVTALSKSGSAVVIIKANEDKIVTKVTVKATTPYVEATGFKFASSTVTVPAGGKTANPATVEFQIAPVPSNGRFTASQIDEIHAILQDVEVKDNATVPNAYITAAELDLKDYKSGECAKDGENLVAELDTTTAKDLAAGLLNKSMKVVLTADATNTFTVGVTAKKLTASSTFKFVPVVSATKVAAPGTITLEVGQTYDLAAKLAYGPSNANVNKSVSYWEESINDGESDYAIVDDGTIKAIAVGSNKIATQLAGQNTTYTTVKVVAKGALTKEEVSLSSTTATMAVGGTSYITLKGAADEAKVEWKVDNDNATIVPATNAVKIFGKKAGTATVTCTVDGTEVGKIAVTVKAADTTTEPTKPGATTNPQTGDSIFAGLF